MLTILIAVLMHPVHASLSEVQWNENTHRLEVSLRLSPEDARWITKTSPKLPDLGNEKFAESDDGPPSEEAQRAVRYLTHRFATHLRPRGRKYSKPGSSKPGSSKPETSQPTPSEVAGNNEICRWIGEESRSGYVWWHFEIIPKDQQPPKNFFITMLLDREANYKHRVVILGLDSSTSLDFTSSQTQQEANFWNR